MSADLASRAAVFLAGLAVAAGGAAFMASAHGLLPGWLPPSTDVARERILTSLRAHDAAALAGDAPRRDEALGLARDELVALLSRRPSDGDHWALLAQIETQMSGFRQPAREALALSRLTARLEQGAIEKRIRLGLIQLPALDDEERQRLSADMRVLLSTPEPRHKVIAILADAARGHDAQRLDLVRAEIAAAAPKWSGTFEQFLREPPKF